MADFIAIWSSARTQFGNSLARSVMKHVVFFSPFFNVVVAYYIFRRTDMPNFGEHIVVGSGLMTLWGTILWTSATDVVRERWMGTFEVLLITPTSFPKILLGKILSNTVLGILAVVLGYLYSAVLFGVRLSVAQPVQFVITVAVAIFAFIGFSLMLALLFTMSRNAGTFANALGTPILLVSGLLFPLTKLPGWCLPFGLSMPLAWARESIRWATTGEPAAPQLWTHSWAMATTGLLVVGLLYFAAAFGLYWYTIERSLRKMGQLGVA